MAAGGKNELFQCEDGDFEGHLSGAITHCGLTGHVLTRIGRDGQVVRVELEPEDEDPYGGGGEE